MTPGSCIILSGGSLVLLLVMDALDLHFDFFSFFALFPDVEPVFSLCVLAGVHDIKHVFRRVLVGFTLSGTVGLEVVQENATVFANFAKVNCLSATSKEEESVELLEEDGTGLVYCAKNSLTVVCQFPEECANSPRGLGVETTEYR